MNMKKKYEGTPIISKGELVAYITPDIIYKTKFDEYEKYSNSFTPGGVGKAKFIEQYPEYKYGCKNFHSLLMDADISGFYSRTGESKDEHIKYDQNHSYKSFKKSQLFNGFPVIDAVFKIDKLFSEMDVSNKTSGGLLYVEWNTLTTDKLNQHIYYETSGWYPAEIVKNYYDKYNINPFIKSYASATEVFNVDFDNFSNEQFRTFLGKCTSKSIDEVWRTNDYNEYMRARYILRDRIVSFKFDNFADNPGYQIIYKSQKKPWNMPVIAVYVKAHQKYNLFKQYNKLIDNNIIPVAVSVDGIEVQEKCDHLFNMNDWKIEHIFTNGSSEPSVIEREIPQPRGEVEFEPNLVVPRFLHISGSGGNGKSQYIIELAKIYPNIMFMAPTNDAAKNLIDRAKELNVEINVDTYHRVFGFGCLDVFPRYKYNMFVLDECSMLSSENLKIIMDKLDKTQKLTLAGDFWQLPCINEVPIYDNHTGIKSYEYKKFEIRELTKKLEAKRRSRIF